MPTPRRPSQPARQQPREDRQQPNTGAERDKGGGERRPVQPPPTNRQPPSGLPDKE